ncbi:MAG TPA: T9SS type A sorting domain-containing protein, partial [Bacteroidia bacterium]|nr:T9SS type A sorting domain-containing protein [Bacteroidia bacterium]
SLSQLKSAPVIQIYPNPNKGIFTVNISGVAENTYIDVYNVLGERIYTQTLKQVQGENEIDLSNHSTGIYLYRISSPTGELISTGKLVIE